MESEKSPKPTTLIAGVMLLLPFGASTLRSLRRNRATQNRTSQAFSLSS